MELRKDPITRSWVVAGHPEREKVRPDPCPLCPENRIETQTLLHCPRKANGRCACIHIFVRCIESRANRDAAPMEFTTAWRRWAHTKLWWGRRSTHAR